MDMKCLSMANRSNTCYSSCTVNACYIDLSNLCCYRRMHAIGSKHCGIDLSYLHRLGSAAEGDIAGHSTWSYLYH